MLRRFAQEICDTTHEIIGHHVLVTDQNAVVIGSSDPTRIESVHAPSITVMKRRIETYTDPVEAARMAGIRPGVTLPVSLGGEVVGSIAIAGDHREVARYGHLVQKQAELFLREQVLHESAGARERAIRELVADIASFDPESDDHAVLVTRGKELGYDLEIPRVCLVMEPCKSSPGWEGTRGSEMREASIRKEIEDILRSAFPEPSSFFSGIGYNRWAVFSSAGTRQEENWFDLTAERFEKCTNNFAEMGLAFPAGAGSIALSIKELHYSYCEAWKALSIGMKKKEQGSIFRIGNYLVEDLLTTINVRKGKRFSEKILGDLKKMSDTEEMTKTFEEWCNDPCCPGSVAKKLNIHRNTLNYRLEKIKRATGLDPRKFSEAFRLHIALALDMLHD
ncbi:MAG TPA: sugar diacid recognition domain-containing protein [Synergistales bacterium]|jgi:carbohydrate diacid regulator|nr:sugar diacid recognition domain-containing protein [Synergistales bacterium]HRV70921.1 sugar diacid recognition domain-containing protein [Thermovirgaceae bacterium]